MFFYALDQDLSLSNVILLRCAYIVRQKDSTRNRGD